MFFSFGSVRTFCDLFKGFYHVFLFCALMKSFKMFYELIPTHLLIVGNKPIYNKVGRLAWRYRTFKECLTKLVYDVVFISLERNTSVMSRNGVLIVPLWN